MNTHFKHLLMRRYLLAFGSLFDNMTITREDASGAEKYRQVVPLEYGPKERWLTRLTQDPDFTQGVAQIVPRMSYELVDIAYDPTRKLNTLQRLAFNSATPGTRPRSYVGVPYTLTMSLTILTKLQQDGMQIVEQILPYFTPDYAIAMRPLADHDELVDVIPITLGSISHADNYEGDFLTRRAIIWDLRFTMKVFFYGPVKTGKPIEEVIVNVYNSTYADLQAPPDETLYPRAQITAVLDPVDQTINANTTRNDITSTTTITEWIFPPVASGSRSPSASQSPSVSASPSRSASTSASISPSPSSSVSPSPSPSSGE